MNQLDIILEESKFYITEVLKFTVHSDWSRYVAFFPYNRIYYVTDGEATIHLKTNDLHLQKGKCYFIPAFQVLSSECQDYMTHFYLHFNTDSVINNIFEYYKPNYEIQAEGKEQWLIETIYDNFEKNTPYSKLITNGAFKMLFSEFFKNTNNQNTDIFKFTEILNYINEHINEKISINTLADIMTLESVYFISLFKKTFGTTPLQYILSKKLHLSQIYLAQNKLTIKEIAFTLGFENEIYFYRLFKEKCGISPSQYRRRATLTPNNSRK